MRSRDRFAGVVLLLLAIGIYLQSSRFPDLPEGHAGPGLFPKLIAGGLFVCGLLLAIPRKQDEERTDAAAPEIDPSNREGWLRISLIVLAILAYPVAHGILGFIVTVSVVAFLVALLLRARPLPAGATAVIATVMIYLLFTQVLGVPL